jgi:multiple sugar transport system ATP-binding protein
VPNGAPGAEGQEVVYGFRPEHMTLGENGVAAKVIVVEPTGADTYVFAEVAGIQTCAIFSERHGFAPGETIRLQPDLAVVHLFDAATGRVLN